MKNRKIILERDIANVKLILANHNFLNTLPYAPNDSSKSVVYVN
jgi:hypothetical protein